MLLDCHNKALMFWFFYFGGTWFLRFSASTKMGFNFINHVCSSGDISQSRREYFGCMEDNVFNLFYVK